MTEPTRVVQTADPIAYDAALAYVGPFNYGDPDTDEKLRIMAAFIAGRSSA